MKKIPTAFLLATLLVAGTVTAATAQISVDIGGGHRYRSSYSSPYYSDFYPSHSSYSYGTPFMNNSGLYRSGWNYGGDYGYNNRYNQRRSLINLDLF